MIWMPISDDYIDKVTAENDFGENIILMFGLFLIMMVNMTLIMPAILLFGWTVQAVCFLFRDTKKDLN